MTQVVTPAAVIDAAIRKANPDDVGSWLDVSETALRLIASGYRYNGSGNQVRLSRDEARDVAARACAFLQLDTAMETVRVELYGMTPNENR